jgi:hypothetical protein
MNIISIHSSPRSGSSWLLSIFDSHKNTKCVYQPLFSYAFKNKIDENSSQTEFDLFINNIKETNDEFCCMKTNLHTNNGINKVLTFEKKEKKNVVMKHTTHHYLIEKCIDFHKDIKIIGLIRNPENVIESQMNAKHEHLKDWLNGTDKNTAKECYFGFNKWLELNNYFIKLKEQYPDNVYLITYEDILKNPLKEIEKLFNFCNIELEKSTIDFIQKSTTTHDEYDYSVFKDKQMIIDRKCSLNNYILNYIKNTK